MGGDRREKRLAIGPAKPPQLMDGASVIQTMKIDLSYRRIGHILASPKR